MTGLRSRGSTAFRAPGLAASTRSRSPRRGLIAKPRLADPGALGDAKGGGALAFLGILLALIGLGALWFLAPDSTSPDAPSVPTPEISAPAPNGADAHGPSAGEGRDEQGHGARDRGDQAPSLSAEVPSVIRRTEQTHDHHHNLIWQFSMLGLAVSALVFAVTYPFARLPREGQRTIATLIGCGTAVMATLAFIAAIDPTPGDGTYNREPAEVGRSTTSSGTPEITRRVHLHHEHPPTFLDVPLLLLGIGLIGLSIPNATLAARSKTEAPAPVVVPG